MTNATSGFASGPYGDLDLLEAARVMGRHSAYKKFAGCVDQLWAAFSARVDLESAQAKLECGSIFHAQFPIVKETKQDSDDANILGALLATAIILYCRATDTMNREGKRSRVPIADRYTAEQKSAHRYMMKLRNTVLAHYGRGDDLQDGFWAKEFLVLELRTTSYLIRHSYERVNYRQHVWEDLENLLPVALKILDGIQLEKEKHLYAEIGRLSECDERFIPLLARHSIPVGSQMHPAGHKSFLHPPTPRKKGQ